MRTHLDECGTSADSSDMLMIFVNVGNSSSRHNFSSQVGIWIYFTRSIMRHLYNSFYFFLFNWGKRV